MLNEFKLQVNSSERLREIGRNLISSLKNQTNRDWQYVHSLVGYEANQGGLSNNPIFDFVSQKYYYDFAIIFRQGHIGFMLFQLWL